MADILEPNFNTFTDTNKTMISTVVSATLPKSNKSELTEPANFTLKHIKVSYLCFNISCMDIIVKCHFWLGWGVGGFVWGWES